MKYRHFVHFEITPRCMQSGIRTLDQNLNSAEEGKPDVFDNLANKLRTNVHVLEMLARIGSGEEELDKVIISVGRENKE